MGKRAKVGVKPAVTKSVNASDGQTKVSKRAGGKGRPALKQKKKRNNQGKRSTVKVPKVDKLAKVTTLHFLRKRAAIEANSNERRVLTKVRN